LNASRTCMLLTEVLRDHGAYREAAQLLIRMSNDVPYYNYRTPT
jgi:hypothetical protein